mmetsp:Transcript_6585/g.10410  ORF Transcript_6585/g.10410 Transcript_6585/m.10410 type:complete len:207 (+) Transcript_6585:1381-2001(+)
MSKILANGKNPSSVTLPFFPIYCPPWLTLTPLPLRANASFLCPAVSSLVCFSCTTCTTDLATGFLAVTTAGLATVTDSAADAVFFCKLARACSLPLDWTASLGFLVALTPTFSSTWARAKAASTMALASLLASASSLASFFLVTGVEARDLNGCTKLADKDAVLLGFACAKPACFAACLSWIALLPKYPSAILKALASLSSVGVAG